VQEYAARTNRGHVEYWRRGDSRYLGRRARDDEVIGEAWRPVPVLRVP
jgi:hypothetical protein